MTITTRWAARTSAASARLGTAGSVYLALDVPAVPKSGVAITGLAVGLAGEASTRGAPAAEGPLPIRPAFDRVFSQADTLRIVYWLARKDGTNAVSSRLEIVNERNEVALGKEGSTERGADGMIEMDVPLSTLVPGSYRLRVTAGEGARMVKREIGLAIRPLEALRNRPGVVY